MDKFWKFYDFLIGLYVVSNWLKEVNGNIWEIVVVLDGYLMLYVRKEILIVINEYFVCSILIFIFEENNC